MRISHTHILRPNQRPDPIVDRRPANTPFAVPDALLAVVFRDTPKSARIRSWGHREIDGRHGYWLACRGGIGMHADPGFGRWQHQMVVRNDGWAVVGIERKLPLEPFRPGDVYLLDAHSPHTLTRDTRIGDGGRYFVVVGFDGDPTGLDEAMATLKTLRSASGGAGKS